MELSSGTLSHIVSERWRGIDVPLLSVLYSGLGIWRIASSGLNSLDGELATYGCLRESRGVDPSNNPYIMIPIYTPIMVTTFTPLPFSTTIAPEARESSVSRMLGGAHSSSRLECS